MKKIVYLFIALFIITGCEATYTIDIDDNYNESLVAIPSDSKDLSRMKEDYFPYPAFYNPDYSEDSDYVEGFGSTQTSNKDDELNVDDSKDEEDDDYVAPSVERYNVSFNNMLSFSYKFGEDYQDSSIPLTYLKEFDAINAATDNSYSNIYAKDFSEIFEEYSKLTKLTINVKTTKKVISHNADTVNGNIYTWVITNKNCKKSIEIVYFDDRYYSPDNKVGTVPADTTDPDNPDPNNNVDPDNGNTVDPDNTNQKDNKNNNDNSTTEKQSKVILYVLYTLFFGLIFGIIIFRTFKNNIKIKK